MFSVCPRCGEYSVEKTIDSSGPYAMCPFCHYAHPFLQQPLFLVTGASGSGKTSVCLELPARLPECVVLDTDILWGMFPEGVEQDYHTMWLRLAKNIGQSGRPVVLCGTSLPQQCELSPERRYFSTLFYLALVCEDAQLLERLKQRPAWRHSGPEEFLEKMLRLNGWLKAQADLTSPPMTLYDSSLTSVQESSQDIARWIRARLPGNS